MKNLPVQFENQNIRRLYDEKTQAWLFSVVDIIQVLTQQPDFQAARKYWKVLKGRLAKEGSQLVTNCYQFKLPADDGKMRLTDVASAETLLRLVQSVPSPKAEPIKLWLAKVGYERMQEMSDPAQALDRARETWQKQGRSAKWIQQRMTGQETRNKLTDYWAGHEIKEGEEFAILTNIIHQEWSGVTVADHKAIKRLNLTKSRENQQNGRMKTTLDLPDDLVKEIKLHAVNEGKKLKDAMAELLRKGLSATAPGSVTAVKAGKATLRRRAELTRKFISGEWGVELSGYEAAQEADRQSAAGGQKPGESEWRSCSTQISGSA